jgi:hypothetical protein
MSRQGLTRAVLLGVILTAVHAQGVQAQDQGRYIVSGDQSRSPEATKQLNCVWFFWWDPPDRYGEMDIQLILGETGRSYNTSGTGIGSEINVGLVLDATYLYSNNFMCGSSGSLDRPIWYWSWEFGQLTWTNPTCDGVAFPVGGRSPTDAVSFAFDASVISSDWDNMRNGWANGGSYWPSVGSSQSVNNTMYTPIGGDRTVTADPTLPPGTPARHDYPTSSFRVNPAYKTKNTSFWSVVGAHELGHALNSDHCQGCSLDRGIMVTAIPEDASGLQPGSRQVLDCEVSQPEHSEPVVSVYLTNAAPPNRRGPSSLREDAMRHKLIALSVALLALGTIAYAGLEHAQEVQKQISAGEEPDYAEPQNLESLVSSTDVIVVAHLVARQEPRVQTTTIQLRGKAVPDTKVFTRYLVQVDRVIKAPAKLRFEGHQVVEQFVGDSSLADFRRGKPEVGNGDLMLFLNYYPTAQTYIIGSWKWQVRKNSDGSAEPVVAGPVAALYREHRVLGASASARTSGDWVTLVQEVEALVPQEQRR